MALVRRFYLAGVIVALAAGGCATARAKTQPEPASLEVPAPPPRVIVPPDPEPVEPPEPVVEPETSPQKPPRRQAPPRSEGKVDPARDKKPETQPPAAEAVNPAPAVPSPTATLQQALPATRAEVVRQVRDQLLQAQNDLRRVNYGALNADARSQYDTAKRFIEQAEQGLREGNLVFAAKVAEKAAGLAASLVGR